MQAKSNVITHVRNVLKTIFLGINIFALMLLLMSFLAWNISPEHTTLFSYIGLGFPFILLANILFFVLWIIFFNWKAAGLNAVVMIVCYSPITTYFALNFTNKDAPANSIKVLSYNVSGVKWQLHKKWDSSHPMVQYLSSVDADIICMQEYMASTSDKHASSRNLQKLLKKYPYYSEAPLRSTRGGYVYGLVCFSKYPIIGTEHLPLNTTDNGSALFKINIDGKIVHVINNHLESNRLTSSDKKLYRDFFKDKGDPVSINDITHNLESRLGVAYKTRAPQADLVAEYVGRVGADAVIVCGDFNDTPISYTYKTISRNLKDAFRETGFGAGITYHENYFWFRIDYILHSKNMKAYNFTIDKVKYSDHYPVWTSLSFK